MSGPHSRVGQAPEARLSVGGAPLPPELAARIREVTVQRDLARADSCAVSLADPDGRAADSELAHLGKVMDVQLGWEGALTPVFSGVVTAWGHRCDRSGTTFTSRGLDGTLSAREATRRLTPLEQDLRQTFFPEVEERSSSGVTLRWEDEILTVDLCADPSRLPSSVTVLGWDPVARAPLRERLLPADLPWAQPSGRSGLELGEARFGEGGAILADLHPRDSTQAREWGLCWLQRRSEEFMTGPITVRGAPALRPGHLITLERLGGSFSGAWHVRGLTHLFSRDGFTTRLRLARSGLAPG